MWNLGAEECHYYNEPVFEDNPIAWYEWYDSCNSFQPEHPAEDPIPPPPPPCRPRKYNVNGRCWEVVCTEEGPEIRPCLSTPETPVLTGILISSIRVTNQGYKMKIISAKGSKTVTVKPGTIKLRHLGTAMMLKRKLPDADIKNISTTFWNKMGSLTLK